MEDVRQKESRHVGLRVQPLLHRVPNTLEDASQLGAWQGGFIGRDDGAAGFGGQ